jgi:tripartite-type tricarboxylate transporter receptor subunit TctC
MNVRRRLIHGLTIGLVKGLNRGLAAAALIATVVTATAGLTATPAAAQSGAAPLRIVVPYPPGGGSDRAARVLAEALQSRMGSPVVVENIVGVGGRLAMRQLAGTSDTNVLVLANPALMVVAPLVFKNIGYEPDRDFQPIAQISAYEFAAAVGPAVPVRELNHLMAWMKANPDKANIGVPATGSLPHIFSLMWADAAKAKVEVVGYKGSAPLSNDLIGGHVPVVVDSLEVLLPSHETGKLRILATSGATRRVATIPTFKETGMRFATQGWNVLYAKAGMPSATAERLSRDIAAVMTTPAVREMFMQAKVDPISANQAATVKMLSAFKAQWEPVIRQSKLQFD